MKKILLPTIAFFVFSITAFAATQFHHFTDEETFGDWYRSSVNKMHTAGVITGYPDGTFKAGNNVNRAELAVMLDRFSKNVIGKDLPEEKHCFEEEGNASIIVYLYDTDGNRLSGATIKMYSRDYTYEDGTRFSKKHETWELEESKDFVKGLYGGKIDGGGNFTLDIYKEGFIHPFEDSVKLELDECGNRITQFRTYVLAEI